MKINYTNLQNEHRAIKHELIEAIATVLDSGKFVAGPYVESFEDEFAKIIGNKYAISLNSGTDALILSLRALGVSAGDEVITVPNSYVSTASSIALVGAKPIFVDVDQHRNINPANIEDAISSRTKAIIPVHLGGKPADMDSINAIAVKHNLPVIDDCAQSVFSRYKEKCVGSLATLSCFSLHPLKNLNACGDGGIVTTNNAKLKERLLLLRNLGLRDRNNCVEWSSNSRLDSIQAAILKVKLKYAEQQVMNRRSCVAGYISRIREIPQISLPKELPYENIAYHTFVIQCERRDDLKKYLEKLEIKTAIHYPVPIHLQAVSGSLGYKKGDFPETEKQSARILTLPIHSGIKDSQLDYICESIRGFYS